MDRRWGSCDVSTCTPVNDLPEDLPGQREERAVFEGEVTGVMLLTQRSSMNPLRIEGMLGCLLVSIG